MTNEEDTFNFHIEDLYAQIDQSEFIILCLVFKQNFLMNKKEKYF